MGDGWQVVGNDFADVPSLPQAVQIGVRLAFAAVLGGIIGFEREHQGKPAGLRTHMLVALGAALFVLIPQQSGVTDAELTSVMQGVVAGIGFLGAGTILHAKREEDIKGLTTAASLWLSAAIGVAAGVGREVTAVLSTALTLVILTLMPKVAWWLFPAQKAKKAARPKDDPAADDDGPRRGPDEPAGPGADAAGI